MVALRMLKKKELVCHRFQLRRDGHQAAWRFVRGRAVIGDDRVLEDGYLACPGIASGTLTPVKKIGRPPHRQRPRRTH
uniref:Uncharacterized protein n=1 Tax=Hyaloperonospora arabidopsidis (strain Emoy2) TaxID=559515 RepID=M4BFG7_HYAAE